MTHPATVARDLVVPVCAVTLVWAAVGDAWSYRIPNRLPALLAGGFAVLASFQPPAFVVGGLLTGLGVLAAGSLLFSRGLMGGGDVKLLSATALWCGPALLAPFALVTSVAGAALALTMLSPLRRLLPPPPARLAVAGGGGASLGRQPMPFGVAIAVGGLWVLSRYAVDFK